MAKVDKSMLSYSILVSQDFGLYLHLKSQEVEAIILLDIVCLSFYSYLAHRSAPSPKHVIALLVFETLSTPPALLVLHPM